MRTLVVAILLVAMGLVMAGCKGLTREEALVALEEASLSSQAGTITGGTIEISTNFTLGQGAQAAAEELRTFIESQMPCAEITLEGATLRVEYGALGGACIYNGQLYSGVHSITLESVDADAVVVEHTWDEISNGIMTVTGEATVTWSEGFATRQVTHDLVWTRLSDGREGTGTGDYSMSALEGSWANGIVLDGTREWNGESGLWELEADAVSARWVDPIPESGEFVLDTPFDKSATLTFTRLDADTIEAVLTSGAKEFRFEVTSTGEID